MARNLKTNKQIDDFIDQVIEKASHHAPNVETTIQPLSDEVRKRITLGVDKLEVYERNGNLARTCWVTINHNRYVFTYNYKAQKIDLRDGSLQGTTIFQFDNATSLRTIATEIGKL